LDEAPPEAVKPHSPAVTSRHWHLPGEPFGRCRKWRAQSTRLTENDMFDSRELPNSVMSRTTMSSSMNFCMRGSRLRSGCSPLSLLTPRKPIWFLPGLRAMATIRNRTQSAPKGNHFCQQNCLAMPTPQSLQCRGNNCRSYARLPGTRASAGAGKGSPGLHSLRLSLQGSSARLSIPGRKFVTIAK